MTAAGPEERRSRGIRHKKAPIPPTRMLLCRWPARRVTTKRGRGASYSLPRVRLTSSGGYGADVVHPPPRQALRSSREAGGRALVTSVMSALLAVVGHAAGGGSLPGSCVLLLSVAAAVGAIATCVAVYGARRSRGLWVPLVALGAGQLGVEAILSAPVHDLPSAPLAAAVAHALATLVLTVALVGVDRSAGCLLVVADWVLPRWWHASEASATPRTGPCPAGRPVRTELEPERHPRSPRGPPALV